MGYSPQQVRAMSLWQYMAVCDAFAKAHGQEDGKLTTEEADDLWDLVKVS